MAEKNVEQELEQLREDFKTLQGDVGELASLLREAGRERVDEARSSTTDALDAYRERLRARADAVGARGRHYAREFEHLVGGNPESSLALAFGVGFVVAKLLDGGRR